MSAIQGLCPECRRATFLGRHKAVKTKLRCPHCKFVFTAGTLAGPPPNAKSFQAKNSPGACGHGEAHSPSLLQFQPASPPQQKLASCHWAPQAKKISRYEIIEELGRGAFGTVYRAFDPNMERDVAVKVLQIRTSLNDENVVARFRREARVAGSLLHPHIVPVHDFLANNDDDGYYIVSAFIKGHGARRCYPRPPARANRSSPPDHSASGKPLAYAHEKGHSCTATSSRA